MTSDNQDSQRFRRWRWPLQGFWLLLLIGLVSTPFFDRLKLADSLENASVGLRFALRGIISPEPDEPPIVLVTVDDLALFPGFSAEEIAAEPWLAFFNEPWPWNRALHGELLNRLLAAGARTVAFDFLFPGPGKGDLEFYEAIEQAGQRVTLAFAFTAVRAGEEVYFMETLPYDDLLPLEDEAALLGFVNVELDDDGVVREAVLVSDSAQRAVPLARSAQQRERLRLLSARLDPRVALAWRAVEQFSPEALQALPPAIGERFPINYAGPTGWFPTIRYTDLFLEDRRKQVAPVLQDALVMVVPWSGIFKDNHATPFGNVFGGEIHAHIARNLLLNNFLSHPSAPVGWLWLGGVAMAVLAGVGWPRAALLKLIALLLLPVACLALAQWAFVAAESILPLVPAIFLVVVGGGVILAVEFFGEQIERKRLRSYFNRYVSREVAEVLLEHGDGFTALNRGENRTVSLLFSDIRGFTGLSEGRSPAELTAQLNEYFEAMVAAVFAHRGSLNKYIGDAIFAVWGDLLSDGAADDAAHALDGALGMRQALAALNTGWGGRADRPSLRIGIGLHSGEAFVGNLGHPDRLEVAVMGEAVNLASRIEGATKAYGVDILVSDSFRKLLPERPFALVDRVRLPGVSQAMDIFLPVGVEDEENAPWVAEWNRAVGLFREGCFDGAEGLISRLPAPPRLREIYLARCRDLSQDLRPKDWDFTIGIIEK